MSNLNILENMNGLLGSNYQVVSNGTTDQIVLAKLPNEYLAPKNTKQSNHNEKQNPESSSQSSKKTTDSEKTTDDYLFQFYLGSLTVVGLFILFRMIQKSK